MIKIGTRGSLLARTQTGWVADLLPAATGHDTELVIIKTEGDNTSIPLDAMPKPGAFVAALRDALLDGRVDVAVHSFKDLPSEQPDGLVIAAVPARANPFDVLVGSTLDDLPHGARVGTSSPRRVRALRRFRPDLEFVPIRGNVDTRIKKVSDGEVAAVVLAAAGMERIGRLSEATEILTSDCLVPAPAQGALAVECRADSPFAAALAALDHHETRLRATAERAVLRGIDAACTTAIGTYAWVTDNDLVLLAELDDHRGVDHARVLETMPLTGDDALARAEQLGLTVAERLLENVS